MVRGDPAVRSWAAGALLFLASGCAPSIAGAPVAAPDPLEAELARIFDAPALVHAHIGVLIRSLDTGETIFERNADRVFVPASNTKLLTAAAALETLGPDFRYLTTLAAGGPIRNGVLEGPLVLTGGGDPTFSSRFLDDPRDAFRAWADSLRAHGITRVAGGIVAVDTAFTDAPLGAGWAWDDLADGYAAEFGALQFNEGVLVLDLFPSRTLQDPGIIVLTPSTQYVRVLNDTRTVDPASPTALQVARDPGSATITVSGQIASGSEGVTETITVRDPTMFLASVVRETLREQGILVEGPAVRHSPFEPASVAVPGSTLIFTHASPPLSEILAGMMKPSQNQIAETLLRTVGHRVRGEGRAAGGVAVVDSLASAWEIGSGMLRMVDGSGLSRYNLASPRLLVGLLEKMDDSAYRESWLAVLPVAGREGTLAGRMRDPPLLDRVLAKSGTLSGVRALSGYLTTARGERVVFSTIVNNHLQTGAVVDQMVEEGLAAVATAR